jgi:cell division protein FtsI (penicillin-binding protein 3)
VTGGAGSIRPPAKAIRPPAKATRAPAKSTRAPAKSTRTAAKSTRTAAKSTRAPAKSTRAPAKSTRAPAKSTRAAAATAVGSRPASRPASRTATRGKARAKDRVPRRPITADSSARSSANSSAGTRRRLLMLLGGLASLFLLIAWKVADLQILSPGHYLAFGTSQTVRSETLAAERGTIYDRNGVPLAMSVPEKTIFADPKLVADPHDAATRLAPILGLDAADLERKLSEPNRFTYLARKVDPKLADQVAALGLTGISFLDESKRSTPAGDVGRSILGSVDIDNKGLSGLESQYADALTGTPGSLTLEQTPGGHTIPVGEHQLVPAQKGDDLVLTIDRAMQFQTEQILADQVGTAQAKGGVAIVTRPATGEILAMADVTRDPKTGAVATSGNNAALTTVYEPGSVMKVVTVSHALETGAVTPDTKIEVPGSYPVGDAVFTDAEAHATEQLTVAQILAQSSNIGTIKIGQKIGKQGIFDALTGLGFGAPTGLAFPFEASGSVLAPSKWSGTSIGTIPIGQGVSATPMQVLDAYNVVADGGMAIAPRLVSSTIGADGQEHPAALDEGHRVFSRDTADKMNLMLRNVVTQGTGTLASVDGYHVAGKTGTARKPGPGGGYLDKNGVTQYQSTFVGMVPAEAPALSILVMIDEPSGGNYFGGSVAAPAFSKIASYGLRQFAVPPPATDIATGTATGAAGSGGAATAIGGVQYLSSGKLRAAAAATPVTAPIAAPKAPTPSGPTTPTTGSPPTTVKKKPPTTTPTTRPQ